MTVNNEPDMLELVEADIPRVDLVGKAANGRSFILMKSEGETTNLLDADTVAELVKEAEAEGADMTDSTKDADVVKDDLDVTEPLSTTGDPLANDPGSPEWETVDAESAQKWVGILGRAKYAVGVLAEREMIEDASGESDGLSNAWNLEDAQSAIDWAIGILATYAAGEQAEADLEKGVLALIAGVVEKITADDLALVEGIAPVVKSGRTTVPEDSIAAMDRGLSNLRKAIAGLPVPPVEEVEKSDIEKPVDLTPEELKKQVDAEAREEAERSRAAAAAPVEVEKEAEPEDVTKDDAAASGDEEPTLEAVFDANGNLKGVVDPSAIQPVQGATADAADPDTPEAPAAPDTAPAPAAAVGTAAAAPAAPAVAKTEKNDENLEEDVTKANIAALVKSAVDEAVAPLQKEIEDLRSPATPKASRYNQKPRDEDLRGQDKGGDIVKAEETVELRKQMTEGATASEREAAKEKLSELAKAAMSGILSGRPVPPQPPRGEAL